MSAERPLVAIIDDEEDIILFLRLALEDNGFGVVGASGSEGAFDFLLANRPDVICLDLLMPGRTGASLYREIRRDATLSACPVVIMSGLGVRSEVEALFTADDQLERPAAFIEKPITIDEMLRTLNDIVGRRHVGAVS